MAGLLEQAGPESAQAGGGRVTGAALSPDGRTGLVREGEENPTLRLIGLADGKAIGDPVTQGTAVGPVLEHAAALSDDGKVLAHADGEGGGDAMRRAVAVRDMVAGKEILRIPVSREEMVHRLVVAPDGRHLAATFAPANLRSLGRRLRRPGMGPAQGPQAPRTPGRLRPRRVQPRRPHPGHHHRVRGGSCVRLGP
ncbi:hypothetical protein NQP46_06470 [Streptomyces albus]|nr:hypothetical protein NQP46_06470 [Streptomyces albus]